MERIRTNSDGVSVTNESRASNSEFNGTDGRGAFAAASFDGVLRTGLAAREKNGPDWIITTRLTVFLTHSIELQEE